MKYLISLFLLLPFFLFSSTPKDSTLNQKSSNTITGNNDRVSILQNIDVDKKNRINIQSTSISINGSNDHVTVIQLINTIQNGRLKQYDPKDTNQVKALIAYLQTIPNNNGTLRQLLQNSQRILHLLTYEYAKVNDNGILNSDKLFTVLENYISDNQKLRSELALLMNHTDQSEYKNTLQSANRKLLAYDNDGYQAVLENYKTQQKSKLEKAKSQVAEIAYLQAENNNLNYKFHDALINIDEALNLYKINVNYLITKAEILTNLLCFNESHIIYDSALANTQVDTLKYRIYNNLGLIYRTEGLYDTAIEYCTKSLSLGKKIYGPMHPKIGLSLANIGLIFDDKGNYDTAIEYYRKAIDIYIKPQRKPDENFAIIYSGIGSSYSEKGDDDKAIEYIRKAIAIQIVLSGKTAPPTATSYVFLADAYNNMGKPDSAILYSQLALDIQSKVLGSEHPDMAISYTTLGSAFSNKKIFSKAIDCFNQAHQIWEKVLGKDHPITSISYERLGNAYLDSGEYDLAIKYHKNALDIRRRLSGEVNLYTVRLYSNIAIDYYNKKDLDSSIIYFTKAVTIQENFYPTNVRSIYKLYTNLGICYTLSGCLDTALQYQYKALAIEDSLHDNSQLVLAELYNNIGATYFEKSNYEKAIEYFNKTLTIRKKILSINNETTLNTYLKYGLCYIQNKEIELGLYYLSKDGMDDSDNVNALRDIGDFYFTNNQPLKAINQYNALLELLEINNISYTDIKLASLNSNLAMSYCAINDKAKALPLFEKAISYCKDLNDNDEDLKYIKKNYDDCVRK